MKVGFLTSSYPADSDDPRGIHVHRLAVALGRAGASVRVAAPSGRDSQYRLDGVEVVPLRSRASRTGHIASGISGIVPNLTHRPWRVVEIPSLLASMRLGAQLLGDIDILHAHWVIPGGWAATEANRSDLPIVMTAHGGDLALVRQYRVLRPLAKKVLAGATHAVGVSRAVSQDLVSLGVPSANITTVPVGAPGRDSLPDRRHTTGIRILYVGGLNRNKSVDTLLKGFAALDRDDRGALSIAGDGPQSADLHRVCRSLGLRNVRFFGSVSPSTAQQLMDDADVLVLPSRSEGKPTVIMEAMAAGLPVLATDIAGTRELVEHDQNGWLFPVGDWKQLASQLRRLEVDPELRQRMGGRGWEMSREFDLKRVAETHVSIYERVMGRT